MNIIDGIYNIVTHPVIELGNFYSGNNRANNAGDALEEYVKDVFADSFGLAEKERIQKQSEVFSYLGNNSNPPDAMLRGGDAIEVKKIESKDSALALNSSYPKQILKVTSPMISTACKNAEYWFEKDMIYVVGIVKKNTTKLNHLCMVYGLDYCASEDCYAKIKTKIKQGVESIPGVEFSETKELGRVNKVDPLGITYLRVRGMWGIENPWNVFSYVYERDYSKEFNFMCIINRDKWENFDNVRKITELEIDGFEIKNIKVKNPDNPAQLKEAKLIIYSK